MAWKLHFLKGLTYSDKVANISESKGTPVTYFLTINFTMCCRTSKREWCWNVAATWTPLDDPMVFPGDMRFGTRSDHALTVYMEPGELRAGVI